MLGHARGQGPDQDLNTHGPTADPDSDNWAELLLTVLTVIIPVFGPGSTSVIPPQP